MPPEQPPDLFSRPVTADDSDEKDDEGKAEYNRELLARLATMIRAISGRPHLEVTTDVDPRTLTETLGALLEEIINHPEKFRQKSSV